MFEFLSKPENFYISQAGGMTVVLIMLTALFIVVNEFVDFGIRQYFEKKEKFSAVDRFINGYLTGFIFSIVVGFILCQWGHPDAQLNRFIAITIVVALVLKYKYIRYKINLKTK